MLNRVVLSGRPSCLHRSLGLRADSMHFRRLCWTTLSLWTTALSSRAAPAQAFSAASSSGNMSSLSTVESSFSLDPPGTLEPVQEILENSWVRQLSPETPENLKKSRGVERLIELDDNRTKRPVYNGHYVLVKPTGLMKPRLVLYSPKVAEMLHLTPDQVESADFLNYVSGNLAIGETWATPYALSIMGTRYTNNCPYGSGDGYGDGRAISIGEFGGYELQLKGAGKTPFHRGADGRAVLRSSIREFLASEAMAQLGVRTTRGLSLVVSGVNTSQRPWYSENSKLQLPTMDDPRLSQYTEEQKRQILSQLRNEKADPNLMITEPNAITCRVAPSFTRVGHFDLFARRAEKASIANADKTNSKYDTSTNEWKELEQLVWHGCYREFREEAYDPFIEEQDIAGAATVMLEQAAERLSSMVASWVRVGFAQGNFNADNCLIGGHTMDYGPFGFMDEYSPLFAKWTGSGNHFGFMNQPSAGFVNYQVLVESVVPVICAAQKDEDAEAVIKNFMERAQELFMGKVDEMFSIKMGLAPGNEASEDLWQNLEPLMRTTRVDWTIFWRRLYEVSRDFDSDSTDYEGMLEKLVGIGDSGSFYETLTLGQRRQYLAWIEQWRDVVKDEDGATERMRLANPKYVLREWMLVDAYSAASTGDEDVLKDLFELIQEPYKEGSTRQSESFFVRAREEALMAGGTAFMS